MSLRTPDPSVPMELQAGPIRLRLVDGELRTLTLGRTELVRRIFFAVRTSTWDTVSPTLAITDLTRSARTFSVGLSAQCERGTVGYDSDAHFAWTARIEGRADGTVVFAVSGAPTADFQTNRLGLSVLLGTPAVCGRPYTVTDRAGHRRSGVFPRLVNAPLMFEPEFQALETKTPDGARLGLALTGSPGTLFSMEDQRNFADTSFKAYAPFAYDYPHLKTGERREATLTLTVAGGKAPPTVRMSTPRLIVATHPEGKLPRIAFGSQGERTWFHGINHEREATRAAPSISFAYFPTEHLFDDDTCWENVPCIVELARAARAIAPGKPIDIHHIALDPTHPRPQRDPRNTRAFGGAWAAACVKYAALARVRSATFDMTTGPARSVLETLRGYTDEAVSDARVESGHLTPVADAFVVGKRLVLWNQTDRPQSVRLPHGKTVTLAPYDVRFLSAEFR